MDIDSGRVVSPLAAAKKTEEGRIRAVQKRLAKGNTVWYTTKERRINLR